MSQAQPDRPRDCLAACLITDAERYTGLTEGMDPASVVELVNRYFGALFGPVLDNGGMVSDVKGDGLLAVWNYDSAGAQLKARVSKACLEIVDRVDELNRRHPAYRLPTRLGIDFGPVALAQVGAHSRFELRPVGDPVNTASRLEELNKTLRTRILVSEAFAQGVSGFLFRELGSFQLRGKRTRTRVRELVAALDECSAREQARCREFGRAVAAFEINALDEARERFQALQANDPEDGPTRYYLQRLEAVTPEAAYAAPRGWISQLWRATR
jgi:adenylate cyclase